MIAAGGWKLGRTIGGGATAIVSLAVAVPSGDLFAIKSSPVTRSALLRREKSFLSSLSSPHIISCLGSDVAGDSYHLYLELAARGPLSDLAGCIDELNIRSFTRQILLALCYIHSEGIAHCDVKGKNILIFSDGQAKLADFGCAVRVMGTPAYMAPEVVRGEKQGFAGDIWSLGCTVVEMATGKSPWQEAAHPVTAIRRIGFSSDVLTLPEWVSGEGKDFVSKCLRRDPKERWTAAELLQHPFVALPMVTSLPSPSLKPGVWLSPKSTLELTLWDSETEDDEGWAVPESLGERIQQLESPPVNWTWDESWISVRRTTEECEPVLSPEFELESEFAGGVLSDDGIVDLICHDEEKMYSVSSFVAQVEAETEDRGPVHSLYLSK
ncbi:Mitogen-activated protein kinase kinase kinase NPK1 [Apostasia shenzhenica]|uniref:Mitogen-activated protein kinase kinase kinase NPK1 n=1 Tax=Apostasia shenzhenica TaxID=1088818 RepID=A0A2I0BBU5_9ASPA|nr:Mitogen-activated protein kinase kinase kinase NPK1 [Apostasia shenzhenica]